MQVDRWIETSFYIRIAIPKTRRSMSRPGLTEAEFRFFIGEANVFTQNWSNSFEFIWKESCREKWSILIKNVFICKKNGTEYHSQLQSWTISWIQCVEDNKLSLMVVAFLPCPRLIFILFWNNFVYILAHPKLLWIP